MNNRSAKDQQLMIVVGTALRLGVAEREPFLWAVCGANKQLYEKAAEAIHLETRTSRFLRRPMVAIPDRD